MTQLLFAFQEMANEIDAFARLADPFIDSASRFVLPSLRGALENYRDQPTEQATDWAIAATSPLRTIVSNGGYEVGGGGGLDLYAEISALWRIKRTPPRKRNGRAETFRLVGIASTKVRLLSPAANGGGATEVAMWRMEVGDSASPGCHFHVQIMGEAEEFPFPKSVPVPRLPGLLLTPTAVIEFALGELFQDDWTKHLARDSANLQRWAPIQQRRFNSLLRWHLEAVNRGGSPWTALKSTKPKEDLFLAAAT